MAQKEFETAFGHFRVIDKEVRQGGSGIIYKVIDDTSDAGEIYAIKVLNPNDATNKKRKRFKNEIGFCMRTSHKNIVKILDYGVTQINTKSSPFYVMPFYPSTLRDLISQGVAPKKSLQYFLQILDGVEFAHLMKVWHRDLKPENILFNEATDTLAVADFGIAHFQEEYLQTIVLTDSKERLANFQYAAPEQRVKGKLVNHKADIFALGLILNEMLTSEIPLGSGYASISSKFPDFAFLDEIVQGMIQQSPENRYDTIDTIKQRLKFLWDDSISRQHYSELTKTVITESEIDDPLVINPIRIVDLNYSNDQLRFTLSTKVNQDWITTFRNPGNFSYIAGVVEPRLVQFTDNIAYLKIPSYMEPTQDIVEYIKNYVIQANSNYKNLREVQQKERIEVERQRLKKQIEEEEKLQRARRNLRI